jgi:hypothetical protein
MCIAVHRTAEDRWEGEEDTEDGMFGDRVLTVAVFVFRQTSCGTCSTGDWSSKVYSQLNILMLESDSRRESKTIFARCDWRLGSRGTAAHMLKLVFRWT